MKFCALISSVLFSLTSAGKKLINHFRSNFGQIKRNFKSPVVLTVSQRMASVWTFARPTALWICLLMELVMSLKKEVTITFFHRKQPVFYNPFLAGSLKSICLRNPRAVPCMRALRNLGTTNLMW